MFNRITSGRGFGRNMHSGRHHRRIDARRRISGARRRLPGRQDEGRCTSAGRPMPAKGVTDTVLAAIDLEKEPANIKERQLRFRKLTIEPGGIVPWHSHDDRPAIIYIAEGEIVEYASNCAGPIVHKAGEIRPETSGTSHWWQNLGNKTVILFVGDVLHDKNDKQHVTTDRRRPSARDAPKFGSPKRGVTSLPSQSRNPPWRRQPTSGSGRDGDAGALLRECCCEPS